MNNKVVLEWAYEPMSYVEKPFSIDGSDRVTRQNTEVLFNYSICISNGKAKISLESQDEYCGDMIEIIRNVLERTFLSMSLKTSECWELGELSELFPNGSRAFLMSTCGQCDQSGATIKDYLIEQKDESGIRSIRLDTRKETLEEKIERNIEARNKEAKIKEGDLGIVAVKRRFGELNVKYMSDPILKIIMGRYLEARQAKNDTEKIRLLYDVRDALQEHFKQEHFKKDGGVKGILKKSNPGEKDTIEAFWDDWGLIANSRIDTRHTGGARVRLELSLKNEKEDTREKERLLEVNSRPVPDVVNASDEYAKKFIELYLNYLEKNPP